MSEEQFLARWSRRKQEARADYAEPAPEQAAEAPAAVDPAAAEPALPETDDLSSLPPIESIDAATDVTAFLRKGIPQELSRAALRRAWTVDPTIRDFVGLAENAWDFNDPSAMAGFGALDYSAEQTHALVGRIVRGVMETAEMLTEPPTETTEENARSAHAQTAFAPSSLPGEAITNLRPLDESTAAELPSNSAASQPEATGEGTSLPRRKHGGALPE